MWNLASPATDLTVRIAFNGLRHDGAIRTAQARGMKGDLSGLKHRCVHGQDVRLSAERVSAAAGHGYHTITRRMWRYRWRAPVVVRLLRRYLKRAIVERRRRRMLTFPVPSQIDLSLECFVAQAALKRLIAGVLTHVRDQVAALGERLAANHALMRFLTCNTKSRKISGVSTLYVAFLSILIWERDI